MILFAVCMCQVFNIDQHLIKSCFDMKDGIQKSTHNMEFID